jgi:hypothetical protein
MVLGNRFHTHELEVGCHLPDTTVEANVGKQWPQLQGHYRSQDTYYGDTQEEFEQGEPR